MENQYRNIDVSLIPDPNEDIPRFNQLSVNKKTIEDLESFKYLINIFDLTIVSDELNYYILDGDDYDLEDFKLFWNSSD